MCNYYFIYGGCCFVSGLFDWYGYRRDDGVNIVPGADWPDEPNEAAYFYRTPSQWLDGQSYDSTSATWYTSQDASWDILYEDTGDTSLEERIGRIDMTLAPYTGSGEIAYSRRVDARLLTLDDSEVAALASWTEGAKASFSAGRLEAANTPGVDDTAVEITHNFADTTPGTGSAPWYYRVIVDGDADEVDWILVKIDWGTPETEIWLNLSAGTFGTVNGERTGSLRGGYWIADGKFHVKAEVGSESSPTILIRLVDGDGSYVFNGSDGEGVDNLSCEVRQELVSDAVNEVAQFDVDAQTINWRYDCLDDLLVDVGTNPEYTDTLLATESFQELVASRYAQRSCAGYATVASILESRPQVNLFGTVFGNMAPACCAASEDDLAFYSSDGIGFDDDGNVLLIYDDVGSSFQFGHGGYVRASLETPLPVLGSFPTGYAGSHPRWYEPIGSVNDDFFPMICIFAPRAYPTVIGLRNPRAKWRQDSATEAPLDAGGGWWIAESVEEYCSINAGEMNISAHSFPDPDVDSGDLLNQIPNWDGMSLKLFDAPDSVLWEDTWTQTRLFGHTASASSDPLETPPEYTVNNRVTYGPPTTVHVWCNMPNTYADSHGDVHAAIFTHSRATIGITGAAPWYSWVEGAEDPPVDPPVEDTPVLQHWLTLAIGGAGAVGMVGTDNVIVEYELWRDSERLRMTGLAAIPPREGTEDKAFVYEDLLYDEDPPSAESAGTVVGKRLICRTAGGVRWYIDTANTDTGTRADCVAASDRWIAVVGFDKDNDGKAYWLFSQEALSGAPEDGPKYAHFPSYFDSIVTNDPFPGGSGTTYVDMVKRSSLVPQTPAVQDYSGA